MYYYNTKTKESAWEMPEEEEEIQILNDEVEVLEQHVASNATVQDPSGAYQEQHQQYDPSQGQHNEQEGDVQG